MKTDPNFDVIRIDGKLKITRDVDMQFRAALQAHAIRIDPRVSIAMAAALADAPLPALETIRFYGSQLDAILAATSPLIQELENFIPGIVKWLNVTGYGNDRRMVHALHLWVEVVNAAHPRGINSNQMH